MKSTNIILSIAVAVLAAVSAVFAYLVMQRNDVVRKGWDDFAERISSTAKTLDRDSGAAIADRVSARRLAIANAAEVARILKPLEERARALVEERDAFADALRAIARNVGAQDIPGDADMRGISTYAAGKDKVVDAVDKAITSRNKVYTRLAEVSRSQLGELIDTNALRNGDTSAIDPLTSAINRKGNRCSAYEKELTEIGRIAGKSGSFDNGENAYAQSAQAVRAAVSELRDNGRKLQSELDSAQATIRAKEKEVSDGNAEIARQKALVSERDQAIRSYKLALGLAADAEHEMPWLDGSAEARKAVVGHVIDVNRDYGFISIDLGTATRVEQKLGDKTLPVDPRITTGMEVIVSRGAIGDDAEFVARVTLGEVGKTCATADIPVDAAKIKEGDFVYLSL
ncbi:MAG: hypothetical protein MJ016_04250 [Victivallaceae bacterium]|nr:hypothetical protein [Victivallaceae bacterium]